MVQIALNVWIR